MEAFLKRAFKFRKIIVVTKLTGIFEVFKNSSNASSEPRVEACTKTP